MRISFRHAFDAAPDRVAHAMLEHGYHERLVDLPTIGERRVLEARELPNGTTRLVVFSRFGGDLPAAVTRAVGGSPLSWDEVSHYDPRDGTWRMEIRPKVFQGRFTGSGHYRFEARGDGTLRSIDLEISVKVPIVGGRVERVIRDGLEDAVEAEARMLADYLAS